MTDKEKLEELYKLLDSKNQQEAIDEIECLREDEEYCSLYR